MDDDCDGKMSAYSKDANLTKREIRWREVRIDREINMQSKLSEMSNIGHR